MSKIKILIPIYNDWESVFQLVEDIDAKIYDLKHEISFLIINDSSTEEKPQNNFDLKKISSIKIIETQLNETCVVTAVRDPITHFMSGKNLIYIQSLSDRSLTFMSISPYLNLRVQ